jgi:thiol-disulfide isomerase/thioredoxin
MSHSRFVVALVAVLALAGCALAGCARTSEVGKGSGYVYADSSTALIKSADRVPAPKLPMKTLFNKPRLSTAGKVVLLNVWASWCGPCRREATALQRIDDDLGAKGVVVLGVNTRDQEAAARAFVTRFAITYESVVDRDGTELLGGFAGVVPKIFTPTSIVIDQQGRVAGWALGEASYSRLRGLIDPLLVGQQLPSPSLP